ncbi:nuclear transport factor 2 family protein [Streptomyces malaysiensis]|uniref:Ketosteroid isomerase-like enzyme n=1 Tax=Streptomyces malaysiensis TaxID=92644 RepID=A0A7X6B127_STRMQ|nr:nuclear transport factor 2 family protein [Streptomyces malaysiensis]NIY69425.1 ketosteroid isomerase-like enzyme [Streptomyces malaysiensis]
MKYPIEVEPLTRILVTQNCERLINEFAWHLDQGSPSSDIAALFTEDGVWELPTHGLRAEGRAELARYFGSFSAQIVSRRLCTNIMVDVLGPDDARGTSYFTTFRIDGPPAAGGPPPPPPVTQVGYYSDTFRRVNGKWHIARRSTAVTFAAPMPRTDAPTVVHR